MIKAIIFDCFGVVAVDGWLPFKRQYFGHDENLMRQAVEYNLLADAGKMGYQQYIRTVADMAGITPETFRAAIEKGMIDKELLDFIAEELKPKYKIAMLSNVASDWLQRELTPEQRGLFEVIALSVQTGYTKPDSRAYTDVATRLGVLPEECLFTDDQPRYCDGAAAVGMQAVVYRDLAQFKAALEPLLTEAG